MNEIIQAIMAQQMAPQQIKVDEMTMRNTGQGVMDTSAQGQDIDTTPGTPAEVADFLEGWANIKKRLGGG